jgi:hypothetical protein
VARAAAETERSSSIDPGPEAAMQGDYAAAKGGRTLTALGIMLRKTGRLDPLRQSDRVIGWLTASALSGWGGACRRTSGGLVAISRWEQRFIQDRCKQPMSLLFASQETGFELIAHCHQLIHLTDDAMLFC